MLKSLILNYIVITQMALHLSFLEYLLCAFRSPDNPFCFLARDVAKGAERGERSWVYGVAEVYYGWLGRDAAGPLPE